MEHRATEEYKELAKVIRDLRDILGRRVTKAHRVHKDFLETKETLGTKVLKAMKDHRGIVEIRERLDTKAI